MSGLEQEFPGAVAARNVDATTPESKAVCQALGFGNHGLVVRAPDGSVLWKQPDHDVDVAAARAAIAELVTARR